MADSLVTELRQNLMELGSANNLSHAACMHQAWLLWAGCQAYCLVIAQRCVSCYLPAGYLSQISSSHAASLASVLAGDWCSFRINQPRQLD